MGVRKRKKRKRRGEKQACIARIGGTTTPDP